MSFLRGYILSIKQHFQYEGSFNDEVTAHPDCSILTGKLIEFFNEYDKIHNFIETVIDLDVPCKEFIYVGCTIQNGVYIRALCDGIIEVDKLFITDLNNLEKSVLLKHSSPEVEVTDGNSSSFSTVSNMHSIYYQLNRIINVVVKNNLIGCQILNCCLKFKFYLPDHILCIMLMYLHRPLLKQITSWIVFGVLEDPREEFFINHIDSLPTGVPGSDDTVTISSNDPSPSSTSEIAEEIYEIKSAYMTSHLSYSLANKILNTGKLVSLLRMAPSEIECVPDLKDSDFGINEEEIINTMKGLEHSDNCHLFEVERVVNSVWISVNKQVKKLAENVGGLFTQHKMLKDVYLMQRGDLMSNFVKYLMNIFKTDPRKISNRDLNFSMKKAVNDTCPNLSSYLDRLVFCLPSGHTFSEGKSYLSILEIHYKKPWPLNFIFSADVMNSYNIIFRFLLKLKISHLNLLNIYHESSNLSSVLKNYVLGIKIKLQQFFINLESYIYDDIIQSENEIWEDAVKKSLTFNEIKVLHMKFLSNILFNLFLIHSEQKSDWNEERRSSTVGRELGRLIIKEEIEKIFTVSNQFCEVISGSLSDSQLKTQLKAINHSFNDQVKKVIRIIHYNFKENDAPTSLVLRLNYNYRYSAQ